MEELARTSSLVAIPQGRQSDAYDIYSVRVKSGRLILYDVFENLYTERGGLESLIGDDTPKIVERILDAFPEDALGEYEPVDIGRSTRRFGELDVNYPMTRLLYVLDEKQFRAYAPVWTGASYERFVSAGTSGQRVLAFPKRRTTTDRDEFTRKMSSYGSVAREVTLTGDEVTPAQFIAAVTAGGRCLREGADIWLRGLRIAVGETEDEWVVLQYRRGSARVSSERGVFLRLPVNDPDSFTRGVEEVYRSVTRLRMKVVRRLAYGNPDAEGIPDGEEEAAALMDEKVRSRFEKFLPEWEL